MFKLSEIKPMNKRGQIIDSVTNIVLGIVVLIFIVFAVLYGIATLNPGSFFSAGSASQNTTNQAVSNFTTGIGNFFNTLPAAFSILGVVLILGFITLLIVIVYRFRNSAGGNNASL